MFSESASMFCDKVSTNWEERDTTLSNSVAIAEVSSVEEALSVASWFNVVMLSVIISRCAFMFWIFPLMLSMDAMQACSASISSWNIVCVLSKALTCVSEAVFISCMISTDWLEFLISSAMIVLIS